MAWKHTQSAHERGYGARWRKIRALVLARDRALCQPCLSFDRVTPAYAVDHITNKANGGTDDPENLQAICPACHQDKTAEEARGRGAKRPVIGADGWPS